MSRLCCTLGNHIHHKLCVEANGDRGNTMIDDEFEFGFAVDWMRKDLGIALAEANNNGALLPVTPLVDQFYAEVQGIDGNRWVTSSLIRRLRS